MDVGPPRPQAQDRVSTKEPVCSGKRNLGQCSLTCAGACSLQKLLHLHVHLGELLGDPACN